MTSIISSILGSHAVEAWPLQINVTSLHLQLGFSYILHNSRFQWYKITNLSYLKLKCPDTYFVFTSVVLV